MSEIFEAYVKIMQENAKARANAEKTATASHAEHTETSFKETNPRMDSLTIEQISKLYNVKLDAPKGMEYKDNIMEVAHPDTVVLLPAYDKLNGLVENEMEGQAIRRNIVNKTPDGLLTQRKYAKQEFVHSLLAIANELDYRQEKQLSKLADACLLQAAGQSITKQGVGFLLPAAAVALVIGAVWAQQHLPMHSDGFDADYQKVISEITDIVNSDQHPIFAEFVGYAYNPQFIQQMQALSAELEKLYTAYHKLLPVLENVEAPHERTDYERIAKQPATQEAAKALQEFKGVVREVWPFIKKVIDNFSNEGFKQRAIQSKGWFSSLVDYSEILHGGKGLISDDFDDVARALKTLQKDIAEIIRSIPVQSEVDAAAHQVVTSDTDLEQHLGQTPAVPAKPGQTADTSTPTASPSVASELNQSLSQVEKLMQEYGVSSFEELKKKLNR